MSAHWWLRVRSNVPAPRALECFTPPRARRPEGLGEDGARREAPALSSPRPWPQIGSERGLDRSPPCAHDPPMPSDRLAKVLKPAEGLLEDQRVAPPPAPTRPA
jgi:hypothetical protein